MAPATRQTPYLNSFSKKLARTCCLIPTFLIFYCRVPKFFRLSVCISFCSRHFFLKSFYIWHFFTGLRHVYRNQGQIWRANHRHIPILFLLSLLPYTNLGLTASNGCVGILLSSDNKKTRTRFTDTRLLIIR